MNAYLTYGIIFVILLALELCYFKVADHFNIIDKPNERSSHSTIVLRGGGIIFLIGIWIWSAFFGFQYPWFLVGLTLVAGISFVDDIHSLPDSVRLVAQFAAAAMAFYQLGILHWSMIIRKTGTMTATVENSLPTIERVESILISQCMRSGTVRTRTE